MNGIRLKESYTRIKDYVIEHGYAEEITWQEKVQLNDIGEHDFLRESAWVILCAGMSVKIVQKYFKDISLCFFEWESAEKIVEMKNYCIENALRYFNNSKKIIAITEVAEIMIASNFDEFKRKLKENPIETLQILPFIGPVTAYHLAKNLGLPFAKADRHLFRLSNAAGYSDVQDFCNTIAFETGDNIQVVDIVLWRFATLRRDYINQFLCYSSIL